MKKTIGLVIVIVVLLGGALIGKYIENHKTEINKEPIIVSVNSGYPEDDYEKRESNYDPDFRFAREIYTGETYEEPTLINKVEEKRLDGMFFNIENHKNNIIKERKNKDTELGKEYLMKGYIHTYQFKEFGISVKTSNYVDDNEYFIENPHNIKRYIDNIYDVVYSNDKTRYVRRYLLTSGATFSKEYLEQHNSFTGTVISKQRENGGDYSIFNTGLVHFYQEISEEINGDNIGADEVGNQTVIYFYNPEVQANYYYKLAYTNACAPSCGIPEKLDIINNQ